MLRFRLATRRVVLHISVITVMEIEIGILRVARRDDAQGALLRGWFERQVLPAFAWRILPVDLPVAMRCVQMLVTDPKADRDALIAATADVHGLIVVTRNTSDFRSSGVELPDPWRLT